MYSEEQHQYQQPLNTFILAHSQQGGNANAKLKRVGSILALSIINIILGVIVMGLQIAALVLFLDTVQSFSEFNLDVVGAGIWCGAFDIVAGSVGCAAASSKRTRALLVTTVVFSALSIAGSVVSGSMAGANASAGYYDWSGGYYCGDCDDWVALEWSLMGFNIAVLINSIALLSLSSAENAIFIPAHKRTVYPTMSDSHQQFISPVNHQKQQQAVLVPYPQQGYTIQPAPSAVPSSSAALTVPQQQQHQQRSVPSAQPAAPSLQQQNQVLLSPVAFTQQNEPPAPADAKTLKPTPSPAVAASAPHQEPSAPSASQVDDASSSSQAPSQPSPRQSPKLSKE